MSVSGTTVSLIIPSYNEENYIANCLDSVVSQDYPSELMEVLIADGGSEDQTREIVAQYAQQYPFIKLIDNPARKQVVALNKMIRLSKGEYIVRMDAHSIYENDYVSKCIGLLATTGASNVGGIQRAEGKTYIQRAIALAMSSPFGVGNAYYRYKNKEMLVDSAYLGAWKRDTLIKLGGFNEEYEINEDYELNYRLRKMGGEILLSPQIKCRYFVRGSVQKLSNQYFKYGMWKVKTLVEHPHSLAYRQLIPSLFVLSLFASVLMLPFYWPLALIIPALYLMGSLLFSATIAFKKGFTFLLVLPAIFAAIHLSFGVGFIKGLWRFGVPTFW